jgi:hypothetical protein
MGDEIEVRTLGDADVLEGEEEFEEAVEHADRSPVG